MDDWDNILRNSHVNLNEVGASSMERKRHQRYYINILISAYLSCNWQERLVIDESRLRSMERKHYRRILSIFKSRYLKYPKSLESNRKFELRISNEMWQHIFRSVVGSYILKFFSVTYLVYIFFLIVCGNYPLTSKRGRCRNLLSNNPRLNWIYLITNIIFLPNPEQGYITKFEILLEGVFQHIIE